MGRVARAEPGILAVAFRQDVATLAVVDAAMERLTAAGMPQAA
jgi:hypothetical protein